MRRSRLQLSALLISLALLMSQPAIAEPFIVAAPGNQPIATIDKGELDGLMGHAVAHALKEMGIDYQPRLLPFKRAYHMVHNGQIDMALSTLKTESRNRQALYSHPILTEYTLLAIPKGNTIHINHIDDLTHLRIGGRLGFSYPLLKAHQIEPIRFQDYESGLKKMVRGQIDLMMIGCITGPYLLQQLGLSDQIEFLPISVGKTPLGVAVNKARWDQKKLHQFETIIDNYQKTTEWRQLLSDYHIESWVHHWPLIDQ